MTRVALWLGSLCGILLLFIAAAGVGGRPAGASSETGQPAVKPRPQPKKKAAAPKPGSEEAIKAFMRQKLAAMRDVLKGIVTEDYALIETNAVRMRKMGTQVEWNIVQGPIYGDYSASFRRSAELLSKAAKEKSADAAMLVYMQATLNCIECHRYVRGPNAKRTNRVQ